MSALLTLLPILGYATIFHIYLNKRSSVSIFFSITFIITILFTFGIFEFLKYGSFSLFYLGVFLLIYTSYKHYNQVVKFITNIPVIIFLLSSIIYLFMMKDAQFFFWDEYSHWGAFIKEMYYFNTFYDASSVASHLNYPPGMSTWDYFIVSNIFFSEGNVYFAYFLLLFSSTLMIYERLTYKQLHWIILIFSTQMILYSGFGHWFSCIYVDHVIGAMFAGLILSYLVDDFKHKELFLFIFPLITITLVKEIGLFFGLSFIGLVFLLEIRNFKLENASNYFSSLKQYRLIGILLTLFLAMILVLKVWGIRQESLGISKELQTISGITKSLLSNTKVLDVKTEEEVKKRFWEVVNNQQLHKERISLNYNEFSYGIMSKFKKELKLSTTGSMLFFIFIFIIAFYTTRQKEKRIDISIIYGYTLFVTIVYLFILYFSFLVAFGNGALRIPSYVRYMNMGILPMYFIGFFVMLPAYQSKINSKQDLNAKIKSFFGVLIIIFLLGYIVNPYLKPMYSQLENRFRKNIDNISNEILKIVPPKSKLFVVFPIKNNGSLKNIMRYSLIPAKTTVSKINFEDKSFEEMLNIYGKYDYVWFSQLNQKIFNKNKTIIRGRDNSTLYVLYKIDIIDNSIKFTPVM